jgi:hypothetical protein
VLQGLALYTAKAGALRLACAPSGLRARPAGDSEIGSSLAARAITRIGVRMNRIGAR